MSDQQHPWTIPREDDDGPPDVGDPRDMAPQSVVRGGMTVVDRDAWLAAVNEAVSTTEPAVRTNGSVLRLLNIDSDGYLCEQVIARGDREPKRVFATFGLAIASQHEAELLRDHWVFGPRFWAWWRGRQEAVKLAKEQGPAPAPETAGSASGNGGFDPRPLFRSSTGGLERADELYEWAGGPTTYDALAVVLDKVWVCGRTTKNWQRAGYKRDYNLSEFWRRIDDPRPLLTLVDGTTVRVELHK